MSVLKQRTQGASRVMFSDELNNVLLCSEYKTNDFGPPSIPELKKKKVFA